MYPPRSCVRDRTRIDWITVRATFRGIQTRAFPSRILRRIHLPQVHFYLGIPLSIRLHIKRVRHVLISFDYVQLSFRSPSTPTYVHLIPHLVLQDAENAKLFSDTVNQVLRRGWGDLRPSVVRSAPSVFEGAGRLFLGTILSARPQRTTLIRPNSCDFGLVYGPGLKHVTATSTCTRDARDRLAVLATFEYRRRAEASSLDHHHIPDVAARVIIKLSLTSKRVRIKSRSIVIWPDVPALLLIIHLRVLHPHLVPSCCSSINTSASSSARNSDHARSSRAPRGSRHGSRPLKCLGALQLFVLQPELLHGIGEISSSSYCPARTICSSEPACARSSAYPARRARPTHHPSPRSLSSPRLLLLQLDQYRRELVPSAIQILFDRLALLEDHRIGEILLLVLAFSRIICSSESARAGSCIGGLATSTPTSTTAYSSAGSAQFHHIVAQFYDVPARRQADDSIYKLYADGGSSWTTCDYLRYKIRTARGVATLDPVLARTNFDAKAPSPETAPPPPTLPSSRPPPSTPLCTSRLYVPSRLALSTAVNSPASGSVKHVLIPGNSSPTRPAMLASPSSTQIRRLTLLDSNPLLVQESVGSCAVCEWARERGRDLYLHGGRYSYGFTTSLGRAGVDPNTPPLRPSRSECAPAVGRLFATIQNAAD
ncbi:hypothetical protein B0H16DRAFT_1776591 [Mycena metata]|uniref:Uncharacterized protein n=1 Tax=Mycena metata TaxID=1033252 RepID=A0AAD7NQ46_9AGAR|nr:hypothetical protein B0H16DRAFT_1776591 [Mycena metata]